MADRLLLVFALIITAVALAPSGAHLFSLAAKIDMPQERYFTVQEIYQGWSWFGIVLFLAIFANAGVAVLVRNEAIAFWLAVASVALILLSLVVFFIWVYPGNAATQNWTVAPENWRDLRTRWEYGHAVNALIMLAAFAAIAGAVTFARR
jgi:hypothetical protein